MRLASPEFHKSLPIIGWQQPEIIQKLARPVDAIEPHVDLVQTQIVDRSFGLPLGVASQRGVRDYFAGQSS